LSSLLQVQDLTSGYGKLSIVQGVSFDVRESEIITLIGPNGSGKSTILKSIFGLADVHGGKIFFDGKEITGAKPEEIARGGIAYVPQRENVFPNLTVYENLEIGTVTMKEKKLARDGISRVFEFLPVLKDVRKKKAGALSGGQRQMLALGRALVLKPRVILLDEPTSALAPQVVGDVLSKIKSVREAGTTILIVEQNAREALEICDRGVVLAAGKIIFAGKPAEILGNDQIIKLFLGV